MGNWAYTRGLHDLGNAVYAYLQPDGTWGWSNSGIIVDGETSLLVDTLYDLKLTGEMLATMRRSLPAAAQIDMLVNTHANGDHCYGNQLVGEARIIASRAHSRGNAGNAAGEHGYAGQAGSLSRRHRGVHQPRFRLFRL